MIEQEILMLVVRHFAITVDQLKGTSTVARVVYPRHVAMYLMREVGKMSYPEIARYMGDRDHSTAIHAVDRIQRYVDLDDERARQDVAPLLVAAQALKCTPVSAADELRSWSLERARVVQLLEAGRTHLLNESIRLGALFDREINRLRVAMAPVAEEESPERPPASDPPLQISVVPAPAHQERRPIAGLRKVNVEVCVWCRRPKHDGICDEHRAALEEAATARRTT